VREGTIRYDTVREIRGVSIDEEKEGDFGILCGGDKCPGVECPTFSSTDPLPCTPPSPVPIVGRDDDEVAGQAA